MCEMEGADSKWYVKHCKSGEILYYYNAATGEKRFANQHHTVSNQLATEQEASFHDTRGSLSLGEVIQEIQETGNCLATPKLNGSERIAVKIEPSFHVTCDQAAGKELDVPGISTCISKKTTPDERNLSSCCIKGEHTSCKLESLNVAENRNRASPTGMGEDSIVRNGLLDVKIAKVESFRRELVGSLNLNGNSVVLNQQVLSQHSVFNADMMACGKTDVEKSLQLPDIEAEQSLCDVQSLHSVAGQQPTTDNIGEIRTIDVDLKLYKCSLCAKTFRRMEALTRHLKIHKTVIFGNAYLLEKANDGMDIEEGAAKDANQLPTSAEKKIYGCSECGKTSKNKKLMGTHCKKHSGIKPYKCNTCEKEFLTAAFLLNHARMHTNERPFKCSHCDKPFKTPSVRYIHEKIHSGLKHYKCSICRTDFSTQGGLNKHRRHIHEKQRPHACEVCGEAFAACSLLVIHRRRHTGERPFKCNQCEKAFIQKGQLQRHSFTHSDKGTFSCGTCSKMFKQKESLRKHQRLHTGEKPHHCKYCEKRFATSTGLNNHLKYHDNKREYGCTMCSKTYNTGNNLQNHMKVHSNEKPFKCTCCEKGFRWKSVLDEHMRSHTDEKPYHCKLCDMTYAYGSGLRSHVKNTHSKEANSHQCTDCNKTFSMMKQLRVHRLEHVGTGYACCHCDDKFVSPILLIGHLKAHDSDSSFKFVCDVCEKSFKDQTNYLRHRAIHGKTKDYKCSYCGKELSRPDHLARHILIHSDEKPFICTNCGKGYRWFTSLQKHIQSQHTGRNA